MKLKSENPENFLSSLKTKKKVEPIGNPADYGYGVKDSKMSLTKKRTLESMMKIELLEGLKPEEINAIWITYMQEKSRIAGMLTVIIKNINYEISLLSKILNFSKKVI